MPYIFRTILLVIIVSCHCSLIAQDSYLLQSVTNDYQKFKAEFEAEFQVIEAVRNDNEESDINVFHKTELPEWFFNQNNTNQNKVFALGISDPQMFEEEAKELAVLRAKAIYTLISGVEISGVSDLYLSDKVKENGELKYSLYQDFFTFQSRNTYCDSLFKIENYYYNSNGEALVLLSYSGPKIESIGDANEMIIYADMYEAFKEGKLYNPHNTFRFELLVGSRKTEIENNEYSTFLFKKRNKSIHLEINFNGMKSSFEQSSFYYHSNAIIDSTDVSGQILEKGLWNAYSISLFKTMGIEMEGSASIQKMEDYTSESNREIIRIKKTSELQVLLGSLNIFQNKLYLSLDVSPINNTHD